MVMIGHPHPNRLDLELGVVFLVYIELTQKLI